MGRPLATLSFELLETFALVVQHDGDAGQAARALAINQPSMSKRLAQLARAGSVLTRPWLRREGKTWFTTPEGQRVLPVVREMLDGYRALQRFSHARPTNVAAVRFACGQTAAVSIVRKALAGFTRSASQAIRISTMRVPARIAGVESGSLDLALVNRTEDELREVTRVPLHVEVLGKMGFGVVCAAGTPWATMLSEDESPLPLKALAGLPLITPEADSSTLIRLHDALSRQPQSQRLDIRIQTGGWLTIIDYVRDRYGVGLINEGVLHMLPKSPKLVYRPISTRQMPAATMSLIARRAANHEDGLDLTEVGRTWRNALRAAFHAFERS